MHTTACASDDNCTFSTKQYSNFILHKIELRVYLLTNYCEV